MALDSESFNKDLYDLLKVRGYNPVPLNAQNQRVKASQEADVIQFEFTKDGESYGTAWVTVDDAQNIIVYYDQEQQDSPSTTTPGVDYDDSWTGFLKHLKNWAQRRQMSFELANKDRLGDDMRQREYYKMKERLGESYHPMGKKASYNDAVPNVKIVLQHNRSLEEGEARFRNVARIYLENVDGERFLAPTTKPGVARVYARHIAEGGLPNDDKWNHIKSICEDYNKMAGFVRATKNGQFNESAQQLVQEGVNHYHNLRETLHKLTTHKGYHNYFESYSPPLMEGDGEDLSEMFMSSSMDPRIEAAMPILSRLSKPVTEMAEVDNLAEWADSVISEKLEMDESLFFPEKKIFVVKGRDKEEEFEAPDEQEAAKLAAEKWKLRSVKGLYVQKKGAKQPPASGNEPGKFSPVQSSDPIERAEQRAKQKLEKGSVGGVVGAIGKIAGSTAGLREMDKEHGSKRSFDNARGPDKTATPVSTKKFAKDAQKLMKKAFKKDVDENFIGMAPQAVAEEQLDELSPKTLQSYADKSFKAGARAGWDKNRLDNPADLKKASDTAEKRVKGLGMATKKLIAKGEVDEGIVDTIKKGVKSVARGNEANRRKWEELGNTMRAKTPDEEKRHGKASDRYASIAQGKGPFGKGPLKKSEEQVDEDLGPEQKRVGQLGPTEKVKNNNIGKLVGASESKEMDPELARIIEMSGLKRPKN